MAGLLGTRALTLPGSVGLEWEHGAGFVELSQSQTETN